MFTLETSKTYTDPSKRRDYHRERYQANRDKILEAAAAKKRALKALGEPEPTRKPVYHPEGDITNYEDGADVCMPHPEMVEDIRSPLEKDRREVMEGIRLRLIWASSAGGDEGTVAKTAVAVIRFAEVEGGHWTDRSLRALHRRLSLAEGLTAARFDAARETLARELFVPL